MFQFFLSLPLLPQIILAPILFLNTLGLLFVLALIPRGVYVIWLEKRALRTVRKPGKDRLTPAQPVVECIAH